MQSVAIPVFVKTHPCGSESNKANSKSHFQLSLGSKGQYSRAGFVVEGAHFRTSSAPFLNPRYAKKHCCNNRQKASSGADLHLD